MSSSYPTDRPPVTRTSPDLSVDPGASGASADGLSVEPGGVTNADSDFVELRRKFRGFVFPMTAAFLAWYLLYVVLSAWARDFMAHKLVGAFNVAFLLGLLQFVSTFAIAWFYSRYASRNLDPLADRIAGRSRGGAR